MNILIKREAANGDVLVATAIAPALREKYPNCKIDFFTQCPGVLYGNLFLDSILTRQQDVDPKKYDKIIDLDLAYEKRPNCNILQAYIDVAEVDKKHCIPYLHCQTVNMPLFTKYVVVHAGITSWVGRNWIHEKWKELSLLIHNSGYQIVCIGNGGDRFVPSDADTRNKATINETATIIRGAKLFVGIDSLPFHIAQAVNTPGVVFFGSIKPETRIIRDNITAVVAENLDCLGCHHRKKAPATVVNVCETGTLNCEHLVTVDQMFAIVSNKLNKISLL